MTTIPPPSGNDPTPIRSGDTGASLPTDLLQDSARRVRTLAAVLAVGWATGLVMNDVVGPLLRDAPTSFGWWPVPGRYLAITGMAISLLVVLNAGRWTTEPERVLNMGLGFEVVSGALFAVLGNYQVHLGVPAVSTVAAMLLITPSLIPVPFGRRLAVSLLIATMDPLAIGWSIWRGAEVEGGGFLIVWAVLPTYLSAFIGLVPLLIIRRLGRQVKAARELGSYRLGQLLGRGGMGEVYLASHRLIARPAAVKLVRPELLEQHDPGRAAMIQERFRREAEAAASLRSPHTIELYDFGVAPDGALYYVMELLEGYDWQTLVERFGPQPPARVVRLLRQVCASLAEAHAAGLVHRDIKPSNLFLCRLGVTSDVVKVLDFGLVRRRHLTGSDPRLTAPEMPAGTPHYLAPEAVDDAGVDHRADLYALGCVGYWMLTGTVVFEGASGLQVVLKHVSETPIRPSERAGRPIPTGLESVILACLAKDPADRPADALALDRLLAACAVPEEWTDERAAAWWRDHPPTPFPRPPVTG